MPDKPRHGAGPRVEFDDASFEEDLAHSSPAGREAGERKRSEIERDGPATEELIACEPEGRDGTRLPRCVKTYIPWPAGHWGMVFQLRINTRHRLEMAFLAFGVRHHPPNSHAPTVYQIAHDRLHVEKTPGSTEA